MNAQLRPFIITNLYRDRSGDELWAGGHPLAIPVLWGA